MKRLFLTVTVVIMSLVLFACNKNKTGRVDGTDKSDNIPGSEVVSVTPADGNESGTTSGELIISDENTDGQNEASTSSDSDKTEAEDSNVDSGSNEAQPTGSENVEATGNGESEGATGDSASEPADVQESIEEGIGPETGESNTDDLAEGTETGSGKTDDTDSSPVHGADSAGSGSEVESENSSDAGDSASGADNVDSGNGKENDTPNPDDTTEKEPNVGDDKANESGSGTSNPLAEEDVDSDVTLDEAWLETFLSIVPTFDSGKFVGTSSAETIDYAYFEDVALDEVHAYMELLEAAEFDCDIDLKEQHDSLQFEAYNDRMWKVSLRYAAGSLRIGSGFIEEAVIISDRYDKLIATTVIGYLPEFTAGKFDSDFEESGGFRYVIFTDVDEDAARDYVADLAAAGFVYDVEDGDSDGMLWYTGTNENEFICDLTYYDGVVRLGCGM